MMINGDCCAQHDGCFVVHDEREPSGRRLQCPLCEAESKIEDLQGELDEAKEEIGGLKDALSSMTEERDTLAEEVKSLEQGA